MFSGLKLARGAPRPGCVRLTTVWSARSRLMARAALSSDQCIAAAGEAIAAVLDGYVQQHELPHELPHASNVSVRNIGGVVHDRLPKLLIEYELAEAAEISVAQLDCVLAELAATVPLARKPTDGEETDETPHRLSPLDVEGRRIELMYPPRPLEGQPARLPPNLSSGEQRQWKQELFETTAIASAVELYRAKFHRFFNEAASSENRASCAELFGRGSPHKEEAKSLWYGLMARDLGDDMLAVAQAHRASKEGDGVRVIDRQAKRLLSLLCNETSPTPQELALELVGRQEQEQGGGGGDEA